MKKAKKVDAYHFGLSAEKAAVWLLKCKGYKILETRHRNPFGEIDIVAYKRKVLAIIEVKARKNFRDCAEAMHPAKQQRLIQAANALLAHSGKWAGRVQGLETNMRFDLIMVVPWRLPRHLPDAWRA